MTAMSDDDEPTQLDYDRFADERRFYQRLLREGRGGNNGDGEDGGNRRLLGWILGILSALSVVGITGGIAMYGEVASLKAAFTQYQTSTDRRLDSLERRP